MKLRDAPTGLDDVRLYVGEVDGNEVERLLVEPAATLREAGADLGDGSHGGPVTTLLIFRRGRYLYIIYYLPGGGVNVTVIPDRSAQ